MTIQRNIILFSHSDEFWLANFKKIYRIWGRRVIQWIQPMVDILCFLGYSYAWLGQYNESLKYSKKVVENLKTQWNN